MSTLCRGFFITGTDTSVGKTLIAAVLLRIFRLSGQRAIGMKPIASGCEQTAAGLRNADALLLQQESSAQLPYELINPFAYRPAIAPHLAARDVARPIDLSQIVAAYHTLAGQADVLIVEGAGGWRAPITDTRDMSDLAATLKLPVVLVVGLRLGCLNHALLTVDSIRAKGLHLAGWVANSIDPTFERRSDNVATLATAINAPCLGVVDYQSTPDVGGTCAHLNVRHLP
jgi:dethiobiotin synthetase